jgi:hypothetical protein
MSLYDYRASISFQLADAPFASLIMAAMRRADTANLAMLQDAWPEVWAELDARYNAAGGAIPGDREYDAIQEARQRWIDQALAETTGGQQ